MWTIWFLAFYRLELSSHFFVAYCILPKFLRHFTGKCIIIILNSLCRCWKPCHLLKVPFDFSPNCLRNIMLKICVRLMIVWLGKSNQQTKFFTCRIKFMSLRPTSFDTAEILQVAWMITDLEELGRYHKVIILRNVVGNSGFIKIYG